MGMNFCVCIHMVCTVLYTKASVLETIKQLIHLFATLSLVMLSLLSTHHSLYYPQTTHTVCELSTFSTLYSFLYILNTVKCGVVTKHVMLHLSTCKLVHSWSCQTDLNWFLLACPPHLYSMRSLYAEGQQNTPDLV